MDNSDEIKKGQDILSEDEHKKIVARAWVQSLESYGYEQHLGKANDCKQLKLNRVWKKIFKHTNLIKFKKIRVLEVGCGGGIHLAKLAAMGCKCTGIDVSKEVLQRANIYFNEIRNICKINIDVQLIKGDFFELKYADIGDDYDLVYNFGVVEHFLNDNLRLEFLRKKYELAKKGGYIISVVPNGTHPLREDMKRYNLGGYNIPEVDYNYELMEKEFRQIGANEINILPHSLFGYINMKRTNKINDKIKLLIYLFFQATPLYLLPPKFCYRHAYSLIGIARKN
jgi:SAM-dependent methyltransferase